MKLSSFSGSLNSPPINDLKVTIQDAYIIQPPRQEQHYTHYSSPYFLSNFEQVINYYVRTVHFFTANQSFKFDSVVETLRRVVAESLLGPFHFLSGRLKLNTNERFEIDLNEPVGIEFLVAQSEFALHEIGDLACPHPAFKEQLVISYPKRDDENPFVGFQVTKFICGGFCMGVTFNHMAFDGVGYKVYLQYLADLAANKPPAIVPFTDRHIVAARRPLQVTFPHIENDPHDKLDSTINDINTTIFDVRVFKITSLDISKLKRKVMEHALAEGSDFGKSFGHDNISGFSILTALIWICKALSNPETLQNPKRLSTIFFVMDVRSVMNPPLTEGYVGNAVIPAHATSLCSELNFSCFSKVVYKVIKGGAKINDEYVRSAIDCAELRKGFPAGECIISTCCKLGYEKIKYPWGKSKYTWAVDFDRKDPIMLFPEVRNDDEELNSNCHNMGHGANILVTLPSDEMIKFGNFFDQFMLELRTSWDKCESKNRPQIVAKM